MGLMQSLSIIFFIFTSILFILNKKIGNTYIVYGLITLAFVLMYGYSPSVQGAFKNAYIMILFSLMIILFSMLIGLITYFRFKNNKLSIIFSVVSSVLFILFMFNVKSMVSYIYVPVLLVKVQEMINNTVKLNSET